MYHVIFRDERKVPYFLTEAGTFVSRNDGGEDFAKLFHYNTDIKSVIADLDEEYQAKAYKYEVPTELERVVKVVDVNGCKGKYTNIYTR